MADVLDSGLAHGLQGERRAFAEGAIENQPLARPGGHRREQAPALEVFVQFPVRHVHRAGDDAVAGPFAVLAQVDEHGVRQPGKGLRHGQRPGLYFRFRL